MAVPTSLDSVVLFSVGLFSAVLISAVDRYSEAGLSEDDERGEVRVRSGTI